jgi:nitrogen fixation/metabolism regulation signal transduction histidine kinase
VENSGAAVSNEQLSQAFEPFSPVGTSNTGLGLSIVKHIVECHGGVVSIFNNSTAPGFTVEVKLPLTRDSEVR